MQSSKKVTTVQVWKPGGKQIELEEPTFPHAEIWLDMKDFTCWNVQLCVTELYMAQHESLWKKCCDGQGLTWGAGA